MANQFKTSFSFEQCKAESGRLTLKHPNKVPCIIKFYKNGSNIKHVKMGCTK